MVERVDNNRDKRDKVIIEDKTDESKVNSILNPNNEVRRLVNEIINNKK